MANARPPTWGDAVARIDVADHRSSRRIRRSLAEWATIIVDDGHDRLNPLERRRRAAYVLWDALAAYRLAGGDVEHLLRVLGLAHLHAHDDDSTGSVGDRARLARARVELDLRPVDDDNAAQHTGHVADVEHRAAALERPRTRTDGQQRTTPGDLDVTTPGEYAAAHDVHVFPVVALTDTD